MSQSDALRAALVAQTLRLCDISSVTGDEAECAAYIEGELRKTSLDVERVGGTVLARTPRSGQTSRGAGGDERPLVLLVGHTDTVPPKPGDGPAHVEPGPGGDRLVGLGASDMKSGLAVMLELARWLSRPGLVSAYRVGMVFYDKEEGPWAISGLGPALEQAAWLREAALAFCLEPSDNVVQVGCLGSLHARVTVLGRSAHSARPWQGVNAIHEAGRLLAVLADRPPRDLAFGGQTFREVISATLASGGKTRNVIPDRFELNLNFRFAPGRSIESAEAELERLVRDSVRCGVEIEMLERAPSGRVVSDNALLRRFIDENGNAVTAKQAWTDVARLGQAGIDAVNLGPGESAQAHQARESTAVSLIIESYRQFERFIAG